MCKVCEFQNKVSEFETHELEQMRDLIISELNLRA